MNTIYRLQESPPPDDRSFLVFNEVRDSFLAFELIVYNEGHEDEVYLYTELDSNEGWSLQDIMDIYKYWCEVPELP